MTATPLYHSSMREIQLTQGQVALVDDKDFEELSRHRWQAKWNPCSKTFYAKRTIYLPDGRRTTVWMHREILGLTDPGVEVDHRDHDGLNNRRENLRACTEWQNQQNRRKGAACSSRFKGVYWFKRTGKWRAQIKSGKVIHVGYFASEEDAARAYDAASRKAFGEFALTNF